MSVICLEIGVSKRGEKIEWRLQQLRRSPSWLAKELGVGRQSVHNWIDGMRPQDDQVWGRIASALGIDKEVLMDDSKPLPEVASVRYPIPEPEVELPKWPSLPANENWEMDLSDCTEFIAVPGFLARRNAQSPERVAAYIDGHSMEPRLLPGDLVVVELVKVPRTGRLVLAKSELGRTVKVLKRVGVSYELHSINEDHGQATAAAWEIEGYIIAIIRDYERGRGIIEWDEAGLGP